MLTTVLLAMLGCTSIVLGLYWAWTNHRRYKENLIVAEELDRLIRDTLAMARKGKKLAKESRAIFSSMSETEKAGDEFSSPAMLSTLVTVLVHKYGNVRLGLKDFALEDDQYVSIYVDTKTQEIILSLSHSLTADNDYLMAPFTDVDDNTFH